MNILRLLRERAKEFDCDVCGSNHGRSDIRIVARLDDRLIVRVTCAKCATSLKLLVRVDREGAALSPVRREPARGQRAPITFDEVIDAHEFLETFQGDARTLFAKRGRVGGSTEA